MKKIACILLSLVMIFTLGINVLAVEEGIDDSENNCQDIFGTEPIGGGTDDGQIGAGDLFGKLVVSAEDANAYQGRTVTVDLVVSENPGFTQLTVNFAGENLTVTSVADGDLGTATLNEGVITVTSDTEITEDGCVAKVTLTAGDEIGEFNVTFTAEAMNGDDGVIAEGGSFKVTVEEATAMPGDTSGDQKVDTTDLAQLKLHLAGASALTGDALIAADINGDGDINTTDLAILKLYLAGAGTLG